MENATAVLKVFLQDCSAGAEAEVSQVGRCLGTKHNQKAQLPPYPAWQLPEASGLIGLFRQNSGLASKLILGCLVTPQVWKAIRKGEIMWI